MHVYLTQPDPAAFIRRHTMNARRSVWAKVVAHIETAPAGKSLRDAGMDPAVEFWVQYRGLCDRLLERSILPVLTIDTSNGWAHAANDVERWLRGHGLAGTDMRCRRT